MFFSLGLFTEALLGVSFILWGFRCNNRDDQATWDKMDAIKSKILSLWDSGPVGVRLGCIKFVQRVILVQSRGVTDPRVSDAPMIPIPPPPFGN